MTYIASGGALNSTHSLITPHIMLGGHNEVYNTQCYNILLYLQDGDGILSSFLMANWHTEAISVNYVNLCNIDAASYSTWVQACHIGRNMAKWTTS